LSALLMLWRKAPRGIAQKLNQNRAMSLDE